jgi:hypothetical protein
MTVSCVNDLDQAHAHFNYTQPSLYAIEGKKAVRKLYSNFAITVYGGGVTEWRAHQLVTSYQYQCERVLRYLALLM